MGIYVILPAMNKNNEVPLHSLDSSICFDLCIDKYYKDFKKLNLTNYNKRIT